MIYTLIIIGFTFGYALLILSYLVVWKKLPDYSNSCPSKSTFISVIIPARNESNHISTTINSILSQNYSKELFEIIVVDDHSEDNTAQIVKSFTQANVRVIQLNQIPLKNEEIAYKKRSIEEGIKLSKGAIIVTTDADCTHNKNWLGTIAATFEEKEVNMVSCPVLFNYNSSLFQKFQALDFLGMIGITAASIQMGMFNLANGANLAFRKSIFEEVNGYQGIDHKASGDDMLLIYKFAQVDAKKVLFLKSNSAVAYTSPANNLSEFIQQRLRWTSKSFSYQDTRITWILAFVYLVNVGLAASLILSICLTSWFYLFLFTTQFVVMSLVDFAFLYRAATFFKRKDILKSFLPSQIIHVIYILVIGLLGNIVQYNWKGRKLK